MHTYVHMHKHHTLAETVLWQRIAIPHQTKHILHVADFMNHMFVTSFTFTIVPFTFCIGIQLASHIYHLKYQEYKLRVVSTFTFWKCICRIKPYHNTKKSRMIMKKIIGVWRLLELLSWREMGVSLLRHRHKNTKTQDLKRLNYVHNTCHILDKKHQLKPYKINHNTDIPGSEKEDERRRQSDPHPQ
jgi:hypothetical protein